MMAAAVGRNKVLNQLLTWAERNETLAPKPFGIWISCNNWDEKVPTRSSLQRVLNIG
jgi:hypothetical protein